MTHEEETNKINLATIIMLPPLAVYRKSKLEQSPKHRNILILNLILTLMLWIPGKTQYKPNILTNIIHF